MFIWIWGSALVSPLLDEWGPTEKNFCFVATATPAYCARHCHLQSVFFSFEKKKEKLNTREKYTNRRAAESMPNERSKFPIGISPHCEINTGLTFLRTPNGTRRRGETTWQGSNVVPAHHPDIEKRTSGKKVNDWYYSKWWPSSPCLFIWQKPIVSAVLCKAKVS